MFVVGVILLSLGIVAYRSEPPPPPYFYSIPLCGFGNKTKDTNTFTKWSSYALTFGQPICPKTPETTNIITFSIPKNVLDEGIMYQPVVYLTNNVKGNITFMHHIKGGGKTHSEMATFSSLAKTEFAYCGGKTIPIYREAPYNNTIEDKTDDYVEGEVLPGTLCNNTIKGCQYEIERSLNSYQLENPYDVTAMSDEGSDLTVQVSLESTERLSTIVIPDLFIEFKVSGLGVAQKKGLALMIVGGIMADLMPAALFFLLQHYYFRKPSPISDDVQGMIPLMEM
ncbi:hypothetical protein SAMD00019534_047850 [Acytostelium subglobosum LB1]|uniref:hypothetical protein n=1 Tax=Acytostelium subglobosum LB1 TaxID=1410327 RepID=UPI000644D208|nr:hypothetical protein SAMD00019534_047850 [Acytostelium subglobosum LB1]GAM21610.1 hypothetical protein SAMD00019534_047850 [Acytostelium subglobosum LB1]|eukprot:XP_012755729.1 hypothetical protein SAMD00019534_047850 [Acytostelium subglobosum LB1]